MKDKQKSIKSALSKLTDEEKILLGLVKKESKPKVKKNYKLKIYYMIGDADGHTNEEAVISVNNPFVKIITEALDKLDVIKGYWGISLNEEHYLGNLKNKKISKLEYDLLCLVTNYAYEEDIVNKFFEEHGFENTEENRRYIQDFDGLFVSDTEYSFLSFEGYELK